MQNIKVKKIKRINGEFIAPADKSISQRAVMISSIAKGRIRIDNFLDCDDTRNAVAAFKAMGVNIRLKKTGSNPPALYIEGKGLHGLKSPGRNMYIGNSGTTMRLICGILAAQNFKSVLTSDASLSQRPMKRITAPLRKMGASISGKKRKTQEYPPLKIRGRQLKAITYVMPVKSAQVKSCILLAGLYADGKTIIKEQLRTRDHSERMLKLFKAKISRQGLNLSLCGGKELSAPKKLFIPGDISSAAFLIVAACLVPGSRLTVRKVGLNPTRSYLLKILKRMGADIKILTKGSRPNAFEPYADLEIKAGPLKAVKITEKDVAFCIDELPILAVAACFARGRTRIHQAGELRIKETDRIHSMVTNLKKMGADIQSLGNDLIINGSGRLHGAILKSFGDHRTAMSMVIAGCLAQGETIIKNTECIDKSFPDFMRILKKITELT